MYFELSVTMSMTIHIPCWDLGLKIDLCPHIWNLSLLSVDVWPRLSGHDLTIEPMTDNGTIHILNPMAQRWFSPFSMQFTDLMVLSHIIGLLFSGPNTRHWICISMHFWKSCNFKTCNTCNIFGNRKYVTIIYNNIIIPSMVGIFYLWTFINLQFLC